MRTIGKDGHFNSHPHEEDDPIFVEPLYVSTYFNSHPHEEDDNNQFSNFCCLRNFNSHPHEEDDGAFLFAPSIYIISTHILTKRMTILSNRMYHQTRYFNSHPHEEDDDASMPEQVQSDISTHILTKRMTENEAGWMNNFIFQLTSSRRG